MKNVFVKITLLFVLLLFYYSYVNAGAIDFSDTWDAVTKITEVSIGEKSWDYNDQISGIATSILTTVKRVLWALLIVYLVYAGTMMVLSMWDDEEKLWSAKKSIRYGLLALLFINIPWTIYDSFSWEKKLETDAGNFTGDANWNIFMNTDMFWETLWNIISFLQYTVLVVAVFMIVLSGIQMILSRGKEEKINETKLRILYSLMAIIFIGVLEVWRNIMITGNFTTTWQWLFAQLANLALYFAWPVAVFFLILAWFYYITAAWNEDKIKKAKNIVINTALASLILIGMYTFFGDLATLKFD